MPARRSWFADNAPPENTGATLTYTPPEEGGFTGGQMPPAATGDTISPITRSNLPQPSSDGWSYLSPTLRINSGGMEQFTNGAWTSNFAQLQGTAGPTSAGSAPTGGYTEAWFRQNFGAPGTPTELIALEPKLNAAGIKVLRNAEGTAGKIQLPNGQIVDLIISAGLGGRGPTWDTGTSGGSFGTSGGSFGTSGGGQAPYAGTFTGGGQYPLASVMGTGFMQPWTTPFKAPTDVTQQNDPGWQFRMKEGLKAIERSAANKGIGLGPATLKEMTRWAQDTASNEYGNVYNRALGEYSMANSIFNTNANNQWGRLGNLSSSGLQAAGMNAGAGSSYANAMSNLYGQYGNALSGGIEDAANARSAGQVGAYNAAGGTANTMADLFSKFAYWYASRPTTTQPPTTQPPKPNPPPPPGGDTE